MTFNICQAIIIYKLMTFLLKIIKGATMKKSSILFSIFILLFSISLFSCSSASSLQRKLIGKWNVEKAHFSTGEVLNNPDMLIVFTKNKYTVYTNGKENFSLSFKVKKDYISYYIETFWKGKKQGERLYFDDDDNVRLELSDELNGKKIDLKYFLKRIID
jgi:uncharacterized membrane protein YtjA (UPF0391 family)